MNRQATAGHLSASIAHELNQPLGAILNNVEAASLMLGSPSPNLEELKAVDAIAETPNGVREIVCRSWAVDGQALVSIRDTGPGIPTERLERLFEPFFTTKQDGMGMGLCIAHTIVEAHDGKISAESRPSGAVFHVSLPLAEARG